MICSSAKGICKIFLSMKGHVLRFVLVKNKNVRNRYFFCLEGGILPCSQGWDFFLSLSAGGQSQSCVLAVCYTDVAAAAAMCVTRVEGRWKLPHPLKDATSGGLKFLLKWGCTRLVNPHQQGVCSNTKRAARSSALKAAWVKKMSLSYFAVPHFRRGSAPFCNKLRALPPSSPALAAMCLGHP